MFGQVSIVWVFLIGSTLVSQSYSGTPCTKQRFGYTSFVCACSSESCDTLEPVKPEANGTYVLYFSDRDTNRFSVRTGNISRGARPPKNRVGLADRTITTVTVNRNNKLQEIIGWGGAFTDATGINIVHLTADLRTKLLNSYFGPDGIEYNIGRVPIGSTDFSYNAYSYDDTEKADPELDKFVLREEDYDYKIPFIKAARGMNPKLHLFASAWTAPKWMKTNGQYTGGGIKDEYYQNWANYYLKFFENYEREGISFWGVTTGNEPSLALVNSNINSVGWLPGKMNRWVSQNLGPTIRNSKYRDLKILTLDDQRLFLPWYPSIIMANGTDKFIDGIAVHWYWDALVPAKVLELTHKRFPNKILLATESCRGDKPWEEAVSLGDWSRAEDYTHGIIEDMNNYVQGWVDWNMALDPTGGPTYINNNVDSPIIVDATTNKFYKQPTFYALGHFSKFLPRGSHKIEQQISERTVEATAFEREDGGIVVVVMNKKETTETVIVNDGTLRHVELQLTPKSINTVILW